MRLLCLYFLTFIWLCSNSLYAGVKDDLRQTLILVASDTGFGTGTVVKSDDYGSYIVTNKHVCNSSKLKLKLANGFDQVMLFNLVTLTQLIDEDAHDYGHIVKVANNYDLCLIYTFLSNLPVIKLASVPPKVGDAINTFQFPIDENTFISKPLKDITYLNGSVAYISDLGVRQGSSGTGVVNSKGELIGLVSGFLITSKDPSKNTLSFLVPLELLKIFLHEIL